jgi:hypothetical protein
MEMPSKGSYAIVGPDEKVLSEAKTEGGELVIADLGK